MSVYSRQSPLDWQPPKPGDLIRRSKNSYRIMKELGRGATSVVLLVKDQATKKTMAMKCEKEDKKRGNDRLWSEAKGLRAVRGSVAPMIFGTFDETAFIIMPRIWKTLAELGKDVDGGLSKSTAIQIAIQTLQGIRAIHNRGILHGNLKLSNIAVDMDQTTVILIGYGFNTWIFGNPSRVDGQEYSRADDIKHWFFLLLSLISPEWIERLTIAAGSKGDGAGTDSIQAKLEMYLPSYLYLPKVMNKIRKYVIMLKWYDCINYDYILTLLEQIDREEKWCDLEEPLDWLKPDNPSKIPRKTANNLKFCCVQ